MLPNSSKYAPNFKWVKNENGGLKRIKEQPINMKQSEVKQIIDEYRKLDQEKKDELLRQEQERTKQEKTKQEEFRKRMSEKKAEEEEKRRQERIKMMESNKKQAMLEAAYEQNIATLTRKIKEENIKQEANRLSQTMLSSLENLSDEQLRDAATKLLLDKDQFEAVVDVYAKAAPLSFDYSDQCTVTRKALSNVLDEATTRIEKSHGEFIQIEPAKTMSR